MNKKFWIVNKINPGSAEILLYGFISQYDISASDFIVELSQLANTYQDIKIRINSGGGSVFEGIAIYNAIAAMVKSGKNITTCIDGIAASMAGVIAMAGKSIEISKYGRLMTHRAAGFADGNVDAIRNYADLLEAAENDLVNIFSSRTGMSEDDVKKTFLVNGVDNWLNAAKCIQYKLVDNVYNAEEVAIPVDTTNVKDICNIFETCLNKTIPIIKNANMKSIAKLLGLPEDATESQIEAALTSFIAANKVAVDTVTNFSRTRAEELFNAGVTAKKFTADKKDIFVPMAIANYEGTKAMIDLMPAAVKPMDIIKKKDPTLLNMSDEGDEIKDVDTTKPGASWDALVAKGMDVVEKLRKEDGALYNKLYKDKYNREPAKMGFAS